VKKNEAKEQKGSHGVFEVREEQLFLLVFFSQRGSLKNCRYIKIYE
jgi:hypothetical protein